MSSDRRIRARQIRLEAAELAFQREHPPHISNGEEFKYRIARESANCAEMVKQTNAPSHIANFTKGLPHDVTSGIIVDSNDYQQFVRGIDSGDPRDFQDTPLGPPGQDGVECPTWQSSFAQNEHLTVRAWESQGAGLTFDLEGPDAQAVTMPPAPTLDSPELAAEMIEVYSMALLRDLPVSLLRNPCAVNTPPPDPRVNTAIARLNASSWISSTGCCQLTPEERRRLRGPFNLQNVFRGITPGDDVGPYVSQFLLIGDTGLGGRPAGPGAGRIPYGSIRINQKVRVADVNKDYMTTWEAWVDVQNGADFRGLESYEPGPPDPVTRAYRFVSTPRDLATYVHYDALYEAYLNACLILLSMGVPFDPGVPFQQPDHLDKQQGFAQFGGPHILSLVTEVATRALKAVRFQKFNVHRRLRPEAVGGWVTRYQNGSTGNLDVVGNLVSALDAPLLADIAAHNATQNATYADRTGDANNGFANSYLLPMAFPEGSPMHPAYGAGHATVAGACVTILKAFFDHGYELRKKDGSFLAYEADTSGSADKWGDSLEDVSSCLDRPLTVEGELNKLASNISIGRNWAGVHYFTDYIESLRMGEQIAIGILQEQKLTYGENFSKTVPLFDGGTVRI